MSKAPRDVSAIIQAMRKIFLGNREYQNSLRFEGYNYAKRTQPDAKIPGGVSHKLNQNYYFTRDARRTHKPPEIISDAQIAAPQPTPQIKA